MKRILSYLAIVAMIVACFAGCAKQTFIVTYNVDGTVTTEHVEDGAKASCAAPEGQQGKEFDGWYLDAELSEKYDETQPVTKSFTLYGTFKTVAPAKHNVTFIVDGIEYKVSVNDGEAASFDTPTKDGYTFNGWYTDSNCTSKYELSTPVKGDLKLYARWTKSVEPQSFTVSFELAGGSVDTAIPAQTITEGGKVIRPETDPVKDGYIFRAWYKEGAVYNFDAVVSSSFALTASWKPEMPSMEVDLTATATSTATGHEAVHAVDGDYDTYWQAQSEAAAILTVDFGVIQEIRAVKQLFASSGEWKFKIEGSVDGTNWAEIVSVASSVAQEEFSVTANGYFRYVRLNVEEGGIPSSREFYITTFDINNGTNVALGMKGSAASWAGGFETENAFDGKYDNYWCANDGGFPQYLAVEWTYTVYVNYVEFFLPNEGTHNYEVEARLEDGSWIKLEEACDHVGQNFRLEVNRALTAVLIREFSGPGWGAMSEMNVYGFKDVANFVTPATEDYKVYNLGDSYVYSVVTSGTSAEYSLDGTTWMPLTVTDGVANVKKHANYVRVPAEDTAKIYATQFKCDLARYVVPTASDSSGDIAFRPGVATMNPENVWVNEHFWCAGSWGGEHTLSLDFGNVCVVNGYSYRFQPTSADNPNPVYKLKIEFSADNENWTTVFDNFESGEAKELYVGTVENIKARYVKITAEYVDGWTNCKNLQIYGVGAPVRSVEIR